MTVRRSLAWTLGAQAVYFVVQYGGSVLLARLLSPRDMGIYTIALTTIGLLALIQSLGLHNYVLREERLTPEKLGTAACVNGLLAMAVAGLMLLLAPLAGRYLGDDGVRRVMATLALAPLLGMLEFPSAALLHREGRFREMAIIQVAKAMVTAVATVALALRGWSYMSLAWGTMAGNLVGLAIATAWVRPHARLRLSLSNWREVARFGSHMWLINLVTTIGSRVPDFALGRLLGLAPLGLYGRASGTVGLAWDNIYFGLVRVLVPSMAQHHRRGESLRPIYLRSLEMTTGFFWPVLAVLAVVAGPLIHVLYGDQWGEAAAVLSILCAARMIWAALPMSWEVFAIKDKVDRQLRIELVRTPIAVALFFAGATQGLHAAAASLIVEALVGSALYGPLLMRLTQTRPSDFARVYWRSALLAAAAVAPVAATMHWVAHWRHDAPLLPVAAGLAAGGLAGLAAAFLTGHALWDEFARLVRTALAGLAVARRADGRVQP